MLPVEDVCEAVVGYKEEVIAVKQHAEAPRAVCVGGWEHNRVGRVCRQREVRHEQHQA